MKLVKNAAVADIFAGYPQPARTTMLALRQLVLDVAADLPDVKELEETLKWGEPSYLSKSGSTLRLAWKQKQADQYGLYFNCNTKLVDTFKELYHDRFEFQGNRALILRKKSELKSAELRQCIAMTLTYHKIKHLPLLGA